jgi:hypothetical protein
VKKIFAVGKIGIYLRITICMANEEGRCGEKEARQENES